MEWSRRVWLNALTARRGFSATEVAAIIAAASLVTAAAKPAVSEYIANAKSVKATQDARTIATAFVRLATDVKSAARQQGGLSKYRLLVTEGEVPELGRGGEPQWLGDQKNGHGSEGGVGSLSEFLLGFRDSTWRAPTGWRGPYIDEHLSADPWNHRYGLNVETFFRAGRNETFVLSAGANGLVETAFTGIGTRAGGDDIVARVSSGGF